VRLLLDDMNTGGLDPTISALAAHPNVEVRLTTRSPCATPACSIS
jgi:hypothetical protein